MTTHSQKVHEYLYDVKSGERVIKTPSPICRFCFNYFKDGDTAYFADREKFIVCRDCLTTKGQVGVYHDIKNNAYLVGSIRISEVREK